MTIQDRPDAAVDAHLQERAARLRREEPAVAAAVEQHAEALVRDGVPSDDALRRSLTAVGR